MERRVELKTVLAVKKNRIAATLGGADELLLAEEDRTIRRIAPRPRNIPLFLKENGTALLICGGIGNCMKDLLAAMGIKVVPGIDGTVSEVLEKQRSGTLVPGRNHSCADHGRTCGECPGTF